MITNVKFKSTVAANPAGPQIYEAELAEMLEVKAGQIASKQAKDLNHVAVVEIDPQNPAAIRVTMQPIGDEHRDAAEKLRARLESRYNNMFFTRLTDGKFFWLWAKKGSRWVPHQLNEAGRACAVRRDDTDGLYELEELKG